MLSWTIRSGLQQTAAILKDLTPTSGIGRPCALSADWGGGSGSGVGGREEGKEEEEGQEEQLTSRVLNFCLISPFCWYTHPVSPQYRVHTLIFGKGLFHGAGDAAQLIQGLNLAQAKS